MEHESPTAVLGQEIAARLAEFSKKRARDRRKAFGIKLGTVILGALITVLLGIKTTAEWEPALKDIELIAGALIVILNAWDAFYDHKALWVKRTAARARLRNLNLGFTMARAAKPELDEASLRRYQATLEQILNDDLSAWVQMRSEPAGHAGATGHPGATEHAEHSGDAGSEAKPKLQKPSGVTAPQ